MSDNDTKPFRKVIVSNNVLEIYEYESEPKAPPRIEKDDDISYVNDLYDFLNGDTQERNRKNRELFQRDSKEDRINERRKQTLRDSRNNVRRLALMNFKGGHTFMTLTVAQNIDDIAYMDNEFKKFMKRFKTRLKNVYRFKDDLKYIAVREFQRRGAIHYHVLVDWVLPVKEEENIKVLERDIGENVWKHGFVDLKSLIDVDNVGAYIIKYMTKDVNIERFKGKKVYLCSKGLERPKEYKGESAEMVIEEYLKNKKETFTNSYTSEYLGKIVYKEYNLLRD